MNLMIITGIKHDQQSLRESVIPARELPYSVMQNEQ
jgi:hypothetical protein